MTEGNRYHRPDEDQGWPKGTKISRGRLIGDAVFLAIFLGVGIVTESFFVQGFFLVVVAITVIIRLVRRGSLISLVALGKDYSDTYRIDGDRLVVTKDDETWSEPISAYEGVVWRNLRVQRGNLASRHHRHSDVFHIVELRHGKDRDRDLNIYTSQEVAGMRARAEATARAFDLPLLRDLGSGEIQRREPGDLGRTMRALDADGKVETGFHLSLKAPPGASWHRIDDALEVQVARTILPQVLIALPFIAFTLFVAFMVPAQPLNKLLVVGGLTLAYGVWVLIGYRIHITPDRVRLDWRLGPATLFRRSVPLADVEEVLNGPSLAAWRAVMVETGGATLRLAPLTDDVADWLRRFLSAAIVAAPRAD